MDPSSGEAKTKERENAAEAEMAESQTEAFADETAQVTPGSGVYEPAAASRKRKRTDFGPSPGKRMSHNPILRTLATVSLSTQRRPEVQRLLEILDLKRDDQFPHCKARLMTVWRDLVAFYKDQLEVDQDGSSPADANPSFPDENANADTLAQFYGAVVFPDLIIDGKPARRAELALIFADTLTKFYEEQGHVDMPPSAARQYVANAVGVSEELLKGKDVRPMLKQHIMDRGQFFTRAVNRKRMREDRARRNRSEQVQKMQNYLATNPSEPSPFSMVAGTSTDATVPTDRSGGADDDESAAQDATTEIANGLDAGEEAPAPVLASSTSDADTIASLTGGVHEPDELSGCVLFQRAATPYKEQQVSAEGVPFRRGRWSLAEDKQLLRALSQACGMEGMNLDTLLTTDLRSHFAKMDKSNARKDIWITTATAFRDRSVLQCQGRVRRLLAQRRKELLNPMSAVDSARSNVWTEGDVKDLEKLVKEKGTSWREIGDSLGRTAEQVRLKWRNIRNDVLFADVNCSMSFEEKKKHKVKYSPQEMSTLLKAISLAYDVPMMAPKSSWPPYQKVRNSHFEEDRWKQPEVRDCLTELYRNGRNWESMTMTYYRWIRKTESDASAGPALGGAPSLTSSSASPDGGGATAIAPAPQEVSKSI